MTAILVILALILIVIGLLGTVLPALPGLPLMFAGAWLLAHSGDYQIIGSNTLIVLGVLVVIGSAMDYVAGLLGAKFTGASKQALWGAFIGSLVGIFFSIPGLILGPLVGAAAGEFWARRNLLAAGKVGIGTFVGFIIGTVAKVGCALAVVFTLIGVFLFSLF
ncbi:uncharacterized protein YqgC (DUF456 family) [Neisseria sp. HSC-16F19]|nr:DUF456 family protein [Neisseria sp. HSC-16F19]MCP2039518.1 uncharacterized protein YqgC (DUF456 family) [Neisseria sp. HSC-16F19]